MSKRMTVKELKLQVDEGFTRVSSRIDALQRKGGLARSEPSDLIKQVKALDLVISEIITRIENIENKQPWWKFKWLKKRNR
ncbi:hypothetical protein KAR91_47600 [Candidatus Pacearchaeota archaeon]|nr:hypothetical protein [Candidatus Pacearchaeota archaeon]